MQNFLDGRVAGAPDSDVGAVVLLAIFDVQVGDLGVMLPDEVDGIVTGASPKGTYVRLLKFAAEGRVVSGAPGIDVGDKVQVRLVSVDVAKGFIDFNRTDEPSWRIRQ